MGSTTNRLDPVEDYARLLMQQATARILENTGFAQAGERALTTLTDITRFMMQKLWIDAKQFAEHAGRIEPNFTDAHMVFENLQFNVTELHDYLQQTYSIPPKRKVPQFPVQLESSSSSLYDPVSERELAERSEDIPRFMPPIHPEWCSNAVSPCSSLPITSVCDATQKSNLEETNSENSNETMMQQQQSTASDNNKDENGMQQTNNQRGSSRSSTSSSKCRVAFPDFSGLTAKDLGLIRQKRSSFASLQNAEPSGISSSANISSVHSNDNINTDHNANTNNKDTTTSPVTINTVKLKHRKAVNHIINIANKDDTSNTSNNAEKLYHHHQQTKLTVSQQQQQQSVSTSNVNDNSANQPSTSTNTEAVSMVRSKEVISSQLKLESDETQSENNFPVRRASGMFGMPPSAVVMHHHQHHHAALGGARMVSTASDSNLLRTAGTGSGAGSGGGGGGASDDGGSPGKSKKKKAKKLHDKEKKEKHKSKDKSHKEKRKQQQQQQEIGGCSLNATASCSSSISSSSCSVFGMNTTQATSTISTSYLQVASAASLVTAAAAAATGKQLISTSRQQFQLHDDLPLSAALVAARGGAGAEPCAVPGTSMNTSCWLDNATIPKSESVRLDVSQAVDEKPSIGCAASSSGLVTKFHVSSTSSSHKAAAALKSPSNNTNEVRRQTHSTKISVSSEQESCSKKSIVAIVAKVVIEGSDSSRSERKAKDSDKGCNSAQRGIRKANGDELGLLSAEGLDSAKRRKQQEGASLGVAGSSEYSCSSATASASAAGIARKTKANPREVLATAAAGKVVGTGTGTGNGAGTGRDKEVKRKTFGERAASEESAKHNANVLKLKFHPSASNLQQHNTHNNNETPKITVKLSRTSDAQQNKDLTALSSSSKAAASEVTMRSQNESQEKEKGDEVVSEAQLNSIEEALMGRLSPKTWEDEGRGEGELVLVVDGKEKSTDGVITASGGVVKKRKHKRVSGLSFDRLIG
ncbi:unnamed protein product [Anisakis simplex]|uniref:BTP domain-containing protein n=1 Tax=Anisakis simplex TaxID=6269 RepID=A0A0M3IYP9_ANISI|nr:unnamed protein product [Anisakis simplex]